MSRRSIVAVLSVAAAALALLSMSQLAAADSSFGSSGTGAGQMDRPEGVAVDRATGNVYVADRGNNRIEVFDASGGFLMAFGWGVATGANKLETCTTSCGKGIQGSGPGQFDFAGEVQVDNDPASPAFRDVYVGERDDPRVQKFSPAGAFVAMFGGGVDKSTGKNLCTAASADLCGAGIPGGGAEQIDGRAHLAVGPAGIVYVADSAFLGFVENQEEFSTRWQTWDPSGAYLGQVSLFGPAPENASSIGVSAAGNVYLGINGGANDMREFGPGGELIRTFPRGADPTFDQADDLFASIPDGPFTAVVSEFDPGGSPIRRFGYEAIVAGLGGIAADPSPAGGVYASEPNRNRVLRISIPPPGPLVPGGCTAGPVGNTAATLNSVVNPEGAATTYHFEYVDQASFEAEGFTGPDTKSSVESDPIAADFAVHPASAEVALVPETTYHCRIVATNAEGAATGVEGVFTTLPPFEITGTWASAVGAGAATLNAAVNPFGIAATGYFEYVDEDSFLKGGFQEAVRVPAAGDPPLDFGSGEAAQTRSVALSGLEAHTRYHYRVVVSDSFFPAGKAGPERVLKTFGEPETADGRKYELVSPSEKNNANVGMPNTSGGLDSEAFPRIQAVAPDGESATFTSFTSFGGGEGAQGTSQYISRRTPAGWTTQNITPPGFVKETLRPPFRGFTPDLRFSGVVTTEPALTGDALEGFENLYLRNNDDGGLVALTTQKPKIAAGEDFFCPGYAGSSSDGRHAFFAANGAFAGAPQGRGFSLYEWSATAGVRLVSVLPSGTPAQPSGGNSFGRTGGGGGCDVGDKTLRHAISDDGSKAFWTFAPPSGATRLMARVNGTETIQLDAVQGGTGPAGNGRFMTADATGSAVLFTDSNKLTNSADGTTDLYRYDLGALAGSRLQNLTPGPGADVQGVLGSSEDGTYVYFAANGALAPGASAGNCSGQGNNGTGSCALYLWHEGDGLRFIATVAGRDAFDWSENPFEQTARVSADGVHLAFTSIASPTGYDNLVEGAPGCLETEKGLTGDPRCAEAYIYDAGDGSIRCASCDPSGARPTAPAPLLVWANPYSPPHDLADDGSRLFFSTSQALQRGDANGVRDVYEFERAGVGSCTVEAEAYVEASDGCIFLLSGGRGDEASYLLGASADGRDVFISTRDRLVGRDQDERYDLYDYRVGGGFPEPPPGETCADLESCRPQSTPPPGADTPSTEGVVEGGNVEPPKARRCPRGTRKVTRGGKTRCVRTGHRRHRRRAGRGRGAGR